MHTVVFGWFGISAVWFLLLASRAGDAPAVSDLPAAARSVQGFRLRRGVRGELHADGFASTRTRSATRFGRFRPRARPDRHAGRDGRCFRRAALADPQARPKPQQHACAPARGTCCAVLVAGHAPAQHADTARADHAGQRDAAADDRQHLPASARSRELASPARPDPAPLPAGFEPSAAADWRATGHRGVETDPARTTVTPRPATAQPQRPPVRPAAAAGSAGLTQDAARRRPPQPTPARAPLYA